MAKKVEHLGGSVPTNDAKEIIETSAPYEVEVTIQGTADLIFHRWSCESVDAKSASAKGSKQKRTDDLESYVYRDKDGNLAIPSEYLRMACIQASKYKQDPRSPRKSLMDLAKAALIVLNPLASLGCKSWDYLDRRRVVVQRSGINRTRPAMRAGWKATFFIQVILPEYISRDLLHDLISTAGKLIGLADFRPTFGRFQIVEFKDIKN